MSLLLATLLDLFFPDPKTPLHPIACLGRLIQWLEKILWPMKQKKRAGGILLLLTLLIPLLPLYFLMESLQPMERTVAETLLIFFLLAGRSLAEEGRNIRESLELEELSSSRRRLSYIVGRDTEELSREEIVRATVETVAENSIDGFFAPFFYMVLGLFFGQPLLMGVAYKCINTLDSMVGYQNERYHDFGFYSARLDDLVNFVPARLGSVLMLLAGYREGLSVKDGWNCLLRDRQKHQSPNAGWPESLMAGLLGIRLGGAHRYGGKLVVKPDLGEDVRPCTLERIDESVGVLIRLQKICFILLALGWGVSRL